MSKARAGGALYPVLLLLGMLIFLGAMIPQVLVQASVGIRQDRGRDSMVLALESAVAFAEGRLKKELSEGLLLKDEPVIRPFRCYPMGENPDFGREKFYDWESRLLKTKVFDVQAPEGSPVTTFTYAYRIQARAWSTKKNGPSEGSEVNGLISVRIGIDKGKSGVALKTLEGISFESMDEQRSGLALGPSAAPTP